MSALDLLSLEDLDRFCHLAFWLGLGADRERHWGDTRREMEEYLAGVPDEAVARFREFVAVEDEIPVPDDHSRRVAELPFSLRTRLLHIAPTVLAEPSEEDLLEQALSEEDSALLLRWVTWTDRSLEGTGSLHRRLHELPAR